MSKLDIIIPIYNEEDCLDELLKRLLQVREDLVGLEVSFIFIDDGSKDRSLALLFAYAKQHTFVKVLSFSRNFGHQIAVTAGLDHSEADYVAIIDADLQDPPELIVDMYKLAQQGFDVVYGKRSVRKGETFFKKITAKVFYKLISKLCDIKIPRDTGDFRLINKKVLQVLQQMREKHRFIRGMVPWAGFKSKALVYERDERFAGETKYPFRKMLRFALDAIFSFSDVPLRLATHLGMWIVSFGVLASSVILYLRIFTAYSVPGITAVILLIIIIGGVQIVMMGIIGQYIGRIFEESKGRPLYVIGESKNIKQDIDEG